MRTAILLVVLLPALAGAGTINIRSVSMDFEDPLMGGSYVELSGSRDFSFDGYAQNAFLESADCAFGCDAGESVSLGLHVSGNDLPGVAELGGIDYTDVGGPSSLEQLSLVVTGHAIVPRFRDVPIRVQRVNAALSGQFYHDGNAIEVLRCPTTVVLTWQNGDGVWFLDRVQYILHRR